MPIWLRKFTFKEIKDHYDEEQKQVEKSKSGNSQTIIDTDGKIQAPEFLKNRKTPIKSTYNKGASRN